MPTINSFFQQIGIAAAPGAVAVGCAVVGLLSLLYGYRLFRLFVFLGGFVVAAALGALFSNGLVPLIAGLAAGVLCLAFMDIGVFLVGALLGGLVAVTCGIESQVVLIAAGIAGGIVALALRKVMIVLSTSWSGAYLLVGVVAGAAGIVDLKVLAAMQIVLTAAGVVCQYTVTSGRTAEKKDPEKRK